MGYSVLTHQAIIDVAWQQTLVPLLKQKYPQASEEQLRQAHAYAYGGAIIQDMGYYPFGSKFFTNLVHYVRTGDFVLAMLREAGTLEEYAFALGALSHYYADNYGHALATNKAVSLVYPDLKNEFGAIITFDEDPVSHVKMEFGFDVLQVARGNYAPEAYHDFIGFEVCAPLLEKAFMQTYGLELKNQFVSLDLAVGTYRRTVSDLFPSLTKAAWNMKAIDIKKAKPGATRRKFLYRISKANYQKNWGTTYQKPNFWEDVLSWLFKILPKIGPQRTLTFKPPTTEAEKLFMESFLTVLEQYTAGVKEISKQATDLPNINLDTGHRMQPGNYHEADETYAELLQKLNKNDFRYLSPDLKVNILDYYQTARRTNLKADSKAWADIQKSLAQLKTVKVTKARLE